MMNMAIAISTTEGCHKLMMSLTGMLTPSPLLSFRFSFLLPIMYVA